MNAIIPRQTVEDIVAVRHQALALYETAFTALNEANAAVSEAHMMASRAHPGTNNFNYGQSEEEKAFHGAISLPDRDRWLRTARRLLDCNIWAYVIERTELERLMDHEARKQLRKQMAYIPARYDHRSGELINQDEIDKGLPEPTVDNIIATIENLMGDSEAIAKRGIANTFSKLDRRFRSHDGFKVGNRIILTYLVSDYGTLNYGRVQDQLYDVERVFYMLDGKLNPPSHGGIIGIIQNERRMLCEGCQSEHESEYIKVRIFKNGNGHLWFQRPDLVERVNKLLADWYGEVIGDEMRDYEADPLKQAKTTPAKRYGFYPTPSAASQEVLGALITHRSPDEPPLLILEPSAGTGNLARPLTIKRNETTGWGADRQEYSYQNRVDCVELQGALAADLADEGIYRRVLTHDFLALKPDQTGLYDRVIMNPPFDRERDIDHVMHALEFLKPGGQLVSIMSAGTEFRETKKSTAFRALMTTMKAKWKDLPPGSFSEVGTNVNTLYVSVWKPAA
ncbi:MAG: DUF4942 domain-containing protein [Cypionkella sp.]